MSFDGYLANMYRAYEQFYGSMQGVACQHGTRVDQAVAARARGYVVAFRYDDETSAWLARVAAAIAERFHAVPYPEHGIHVDISVTISAQTDTATLQLLTDSVDVVVPVIRDEPVTIQHVKVLYNRSTVILAGVPNLHFLRVALGVQEQMLQRGFAQQTVPWGAYPVLCRSVAAQPLDAEFDAFVRTQTFPGQCVLGWIDVGTFSMSPEKIEVEVYASVPISG